MRCVSVVCAAFELRAFSLAERMIEEYVVARKRQSHNILCFFEMLLCKVSNASSPSAPPRHRETIAADAPRASLRATPVTGFAATPAAPFAVFPRRFRAHLHAARERVTMRRPRW